MTAPDLPPANGDETFIDTFQYGRLASAYKPLAEDTSTDTPRPDNAGEPPELYTEAHYEDLKFLFSALAHLDESSTHISITERGIHVVGGNPSKTMGTAAWIPKSFFDTYIFHTPGVVGFNFNSLKSAFPALTDYVGQDTFTFNLTPVEYTHDTMSDDWSELTVGTDETSLTMRACKPTHKDPITFGRTTGDVHVSFDPSILREGLLRESRTHSSPTAVHDTADTIDLYVEDGDAYLAVVDEASETAVEVQKLYGESSSLATDPPLLTVSLDLLAEYLNDLMWKLEYGDRTLTFTWNDESVVSKFRVEDAYIETVTACRNVNRDSPFPTVEERARSAD